MGGLKKPKYRLDYSSRWPSQSTRHGSFSTVGSGHLADVSSVDSRQEFEPLDRVLKMRAVTASSDAPAAHYGIPSTVPEDDVEKPLGPFEIIRDTASTGVLPVLKEAVGYAKQSTTHNSEDSTSGSDFRLITRENEIREKSLFGLMSREKSLIKVFNCDTDGTSDSTTGEELPSKRINNLSLTVPAFAQHVGRNNMYCTDSYDSSTSASHNSNNATGRKEIKARTDGHKLFDEYFRETLDRHLDSVGLTTMSPPLSPVDDPHSLKYIPSSHKLQTDHAADSQGHDLALHPERPPQPANPSARKPLPLNDIKANPFRHAGRFRHWSVADTMPDEYLSDTDSDGDWNEQFAVSVFDRRSEEGGKVDASFTPTARNSLRRGSHQSQTSIGSRTSQKGRKDNGCSRVLALLTACCTCCCRSSNAEE